MTYLKSRDVTLDNSERLVHLLVRKTTDAVGDDLLFVIGHKARLILVALAAALLVLFADSTAALLNLLLARLRLPKLLGGGSLLLFLGDHLHLTGHLCDLLLQ